MPDPYQTEPLPPPRTAPKPATSPAPLTGQPVAGAPTAGTHLPEFATASATKQKMFLILGATMALGAAIATIYYGGRQETGGFWEFVRHVGRAALVLYFIALHTGTGVLAVWIAARLTQHKFGSFEGAATRMFVLVSTFFFVSSIELQFGSGDFARYIGSVIPVLIAGGLYWLLAMALFGKRVDHVNTLSIVHLALFVVFWIGYPLYGAVTRPQSVPTAPPAPAATAPATPPPATAPVIPAVPTGAAPATGQAPPG